ncbi:MAG: hypothetical protein PHQ40_02255 [Anaerolineaceae bacterium]|nr:hypothetical protein [Anaerolineaceae bacterium]
MPKANNSSFVAQSLGDFSKDYQKNNHAVIKARKLKSRDHDDSLIMVGSAEDAADLENNQDMSLPAENEEIPFDYGKPKHQLNLPLIIMTDTKVSENSDMAYGLLVKANNPPRFFQRGGKLVLLSQDENGKCLLNIANKEILTHHLHRVANFVLLEKNGVQSPAAYIQTVVNDILGRSNLPGIPAFHGIINTPIVREDGTILATPGYDQVTGLFYSPIANLVDINIPLKPIQKDIHTAKAILEEMIHEFPFDGEASKTNYIGLLLTTMARSAIPRPSQVPLALISATKQGTGKTNLGKFACTISTGHPAKITPIPSSEEEWVKTSTSLLNENQRVVLLDNLSTVLKSDILNALITAEEWFTRLLGTNRMFNFPQDMVLIVTGNNIRLGGDTPRRCFWIRLDAKTSQPENRHFLIKNLPKWVLENIKDLVWALLVLVRAWFVAGCPEPTTSTMGGFEEWSRFVGGILECAGYSQFLANRQQMTDTAVDDAMENEIFLRALQKQYPARSVRAVEIAKDIEKCSSLQEFLPGCLPDPNGKGRLMRDTLPHSLGEYFKKLNGTPFGDSNVRVERDGVHTHTGTALWRFRADTAG